MIRIQMSQPKWILRFLWILFSNAENSPALGWDGGVSEQLLILPIFPAKADILGVFHSHVYRFAFRLRAEYIYMKHRWRVVQPSRFVPYVFSNQHVLNRFLGDWRFRTILQGSEIRTRVCWNFDSQKRKVSKILKLLSVSEKLLKNNGIKNHSILTDMRNDI